MTDIELSKERVTILAADDGLAIEIPVELQTLERLIREDEKEKCAKIAGDFHRYDRAKDVYMSLFKDMPANHK